MTSFRSFMSSALFIFNIVEAALGMPFANLTFKLDVMPAVFETGDGMYTIIWTTTHRGTGSVRYTFDGKEYIVNDQAGGNIRCNDTVHSVRVPKEHLDNNTYTVYSQYVAFKAGYFAMKGKTVFSEPVKFNGYNGQQRVNALVLSDIHSEFEPVRKSVATFEEKPDIVILNGDIANSMETKLNYKQIFYYARELSGGAVPVVYARGNHEPRGEYASEMMKYFKTDSGDLYFTFNYGPAWFLVLDCGEDKADDHEEYSGLVDFSAYIAKESKWLSSLTRENNENYDYRICVTHNPRVEKEHGNNWTGDLERLGIDAVISGHWHCLNLEFEDGTTSFKRLITGGQCGEHFVATMMSFSEGKISFSSKDENGTVCGSREFAVNQ